MEIGATDGASAHAYQKLTVARYGFWDVAFSQRALVSLRGNVFQ